MIIIIKIIITIIIIIIIVTIIVITTTTTNHTFHFCRYLRKTPGEHRYLPKKAGIFPVIIVKN